MRTEDEERKNEHEIRGKRIGGRRVKGVREREC